MDVISLRIAFARCEWYICYRKAIPMRDRNKLLPFPSHLSVSPAVCLCLLPHLTLLKYLAQALACAQMAADEREHKTV